MSIAGILGRRFIWIKRESAGLSAGVIVSVLVIRIVTSLAFMIGGPCAVFTERVTGLGLVDWNKAKEDNEKCKDDFH